VGSCLSPVTTRPTLLPDAEPYRASLLRFGLSRAPQSGPHHCRGDRLTGPQTPWRCSIEEEGWAEGVFAQQRWLNERPRLIRPNWRPPPDRSNCWCCFCAN